MAAQTGISTAVDLLIALGIGVFIIVLLLALTYQSQATAANQIATQYGNTAAVYKNFNSTSNNVVGSYGNNLPLAIFALVMITVIVVVLVAIRQGKVGGSGSYLS